jgi:hypothetical protein
MLHKMKSTYGEIAKYFPGLSEKISSAAHKRQILLGMARRGEQKPRCKTPLGKAFTSYVKKRCNNAVFIDAINKIAPHWLGRSSLRKKQILLDMAKKGKPKPHRKTSLGAAFVSYTRDSGKRDSYDPEFTKDIKKLRPNWLIPRYIQIANENKQRLIDMANKGKPRPHQNTYLGMTLTSYTSMSFHSEFIKDIKKLRPDWFLVETIIQRKKELLDMARKGDPKPNWKTVLGQAFGKYTTETSVLYDLVFTKNMRKIKPDWLLPRHMQIANQKKQTLLEMAKRGDPRPIQKKHPLGGCLSNYTRNDPVFNKKIRKNRPDWFIDRSENADQKKQTLLKMARDGKPKPHHKTPLGAAFVRFTCDSSSSQDQIFIKKIKKLRPDWFLHKLIQVADKKKQTLIEMAKEGKHKPNHNTPLGRSLGNYTQKSSNSYNLFFAKEIKRLAPNWFERNK